MLAVHSENTRKIRSIINDLWREGFVIIERKEFAKLFNRENYCQEVRTKFAEAWDDFGADSDNLYVRRLPTDHMLIIHGKPQKFIE